MVRADGLLSQARCYLLRGEALKYLDAGDGRNLSLQEIHPGTELLSDEVAPAACLQLGDQALIGQPKLFPVIRSCYPRDGTLQRQ